MARQCRFGLEVALRSGEPAFDGLLEIVAAASATGFDALWFTDNPADPAPPGLVAPPTPDAVTLVGGLAVGAPSDLALGVVADLAHGRHPAILARDLLSLDLLSGGRAAVVLSDTASAAGSGGLARLAEAATTCRALFAGEAPPRGGRYYPVGDARPRVDRLGTGPVLGVSLDGSGPEAAIPDAPYPGGVGPVLDEALVACVAVADAVVTSVPASQLLGVAHLVAAAATRAGLQAAPPVWWWHTITAEGPAVDAVVPGDRGVIARDVPTVPLTPSTVQALARALKIGPNGG